MDPADAAPGRPAVPRERLPVAGRPQAEIMRPPHSPGRIPVGDEQPGDGVADRLEQIDQQVRGSREYQAIKAFLPERADKDEATRRHEHRNDHDNDHHDGDHTAPPAPELAQPPQPPAARPTPPTGTDGAPVQKSDPLALDLDGNGLQTSGVSNGVRFDIDADGVVNVSAMDLGRGTAQTNQVRASSGEDERASPGTGCRGRRSARLRI